MATRLILLTLILLASGCATTEFVRVAPQEPPVIARPQLEIENLASGDSPARVLQAHRIAILQLQQWGLELEAALGAYRSKK